jgi:hypothetical protein
VIQRCAQVLALLLALTGCTGACTNSGVEGLYELSVRGVSYALQLSAGGQGTLFVSGKAVGDLHWELVVASDRQNLELNASGFVFTALSGIAPLKTGPANTIAVSAGVFGPAPECTKRGSMSKLVLDYDEGVEFRRR